MSRSSDAARNWRTDAHITDTDSEAQRSQAPEPDQAAGGPETTEVEMADLAKTLKIIESGGLGQIPPEHAAKVVRRIVDGEDDEPRLDVAAFNSAS